MNIKNKALFSTLLVSFIFLTGCTCLLLAGCGGGGGDGPSSGVGPEDLPLGLLPLLSGPKGIALESGGQTALVTEFDSGELSRVNLSTGLVKTIATGLKSPFAVVIEPGGLTALITEACPGAHSISRVDLEHGNVTSVIVSGVECFAGLTLESSSSVLLTEPNSAQISRINLNVGRHEAVITASELTGANGLALENDNTLLVLSQPIKFVGGSTANVFNISRVNLSTSTVQSLIMDLMINNFYGIVIESGGNSALFTAESANVGQLMRVSGLSTDTPFLNTLIQGLNGPAGFVTEPGGSVIIVETASNDITRTTLSQCVTAPCPAPAPLIPGLGHPVQIVMGADGSTALVSEQNSLVPGDDVGELSRIDVRTGKVTTLISGLDTPEEFVLKGNMVYVVEKKNPGRLLEINLETKQTRQVNTTPLEFPSGIVLEDDSTVLITERGAGRISRVNLVDGSVIPLPTTPINSLEAPSGIVMENASSAIVSEIGTGDLNAGELSRVNIATGQVQRIVTGLDFPSGIAMMPQENSVLVVEQLSGKLSKVKIAGPLSPTASSIIPVADGLHRPERVAIEPGGDTALVTETNPDGIRRVKIK